jgi:uncharacterized protein (DUF4415 family)
MLNVKTKSGRTFELPSDEEDALIRTGIQSDQDTREITTAEFATMRRRVGRPPIVTTRPMLSMRVDVDVLTHLRAGGKGWQTRVNALLRQAIAQGQV